VLTGGRWRSFAEVEEIEFDESAGTVKLRVPPRETGPLEVRFVDPLPRGTTFEEITIDVRPPNLRDGIRVDGTLDPFEAELIAPFAAGGAVLVDMFDSVTLEYAGTIQAEYEVAVDSRHVYLRVTWDDATEDREFDLNLDQNARRHDVLFLEIDQDADGVLEDGEDTRGVFTYMTGSGCVDSHYDQALESGIDDTTTDGVARMAWDDVTERYTAELLFPRSPDANGHDADLSPGSTARFNVLFGDGLGTAAVAPRVGGLFGLTGSDSSGWGVLPLPPELPGRYAPVASPSLGTFVGVSGHEHPKGELYELDFTTGDLIRLTFNDRYEDWVSVAPDGSYAAYGSSPEYADYAGYEIYKWERATGLETALTSNALLEGHPAISPDNASIAWAFFEANGEVNVYVMDRHGGNVVRITDGSVEKNDPEWTKDGRIVVKSFEWTGLEQLAIMDLQGATVLRLTDNPNSDHDGYVTADNAWVLYERFEGTWPWTQDWNLTNSTPWSIRMVSMDGRRHRRLVLDALANWLPVMGPEGVIVHFVNTCFNGGEMRMIDRFGVDRGRLAPAQSHVRYMDWK